MENHFHMVLETPHANLVAGMPIPLNDTFLATNTATVLVNGITASRQGDYFRREVSVANSSAALVQWLTSVATNGNGTTTVARLSYVPQTPEAFSYDGDGNLTQDGLWQYAWDGENRLKRIETRTNAITDSAYWQRIDCDYDYMSRRVRKQVYPWNPSTNNYHLSTSTRFFYDGWNLIGQADEVTGTRLSFLWGTDLSGSLKGAGGVGGVVAMTVHNGALAGTYFYGYDGNGNVAVLVNAADGTEAARYEYGPFGELIRATGPLARLNPFRFSTKYHDDESDLTYYGYRSYNPSTGRWLSRDPLGDVDFLTQYAGDKSPEEILELATQALNSSYDFVGNSPVVRIDIIGLENVQVVVATAIRPPDAQAGLKTSHSVVVNEYGQIVSVSTFTGTTIIGGIPLTGVSTFRQWVTGTHPNFTVTMIVSSHSKALPSGYDIDYNLDVNLNFCARTGTLSGLHDQYPSYMVRVKGKTIYDWQQKGSWVNLWGPGNITPNVSLYW